MYLARPRKNLEASKSITLVKSEYFLSRLGQERAGPDSEFRDGQFPIKRVVSRDRCNTGLQFIRRSLKSQSFSWALIETQSDRVQVRLSELS